MMMVLALDRERLSDCVKRGACDDHTQCKRLKVNMVIKVPKRD